MRPWQFRLLMPALVWSLVTLGSSVTVAATDPIEEARHALRSHSIGTDTASLAGYLARQCPTPLQSKAIARHIDHLGHDDFQTRTAAANELLKKGPIAAPALRHAFDSTDVEVALQARRLWREIESIDNSAEKYQLVAYALRLLGEGKHSQSVPAVLRLIDFTDSQPLLDQATLIIWKSASAEHADLLRTAMVSESLALRIAAIPAFETAMGEEAVTDLQPLLQSAESEIRLAAARALLDRLPNESLLALVALLDEPDRSVRMQAAWLLNELSPTENPVENKLTAFEEAVARWKLLAKAADLNALKLPLGDRRLITGAYPLSFEEQFAKAMAKIKDSYGDFTYEHTSAMSAFVDDGLLHLGGNVAVLEADHRLAISAQKVVGAETFPSKFRVATRLTGSKGGEGGWHMGLSIGQLKFLFHPGHSGGGYRVEDVTTHKYLVTNQTMPFTPVNDTMHDMSVAVSPGTQPGTVAFDVTITNGVDGTTSFSHRYQCSTELCGPLNRVGLERSGRTGGDAMFDWLTIDLSGKDGTGR